jgi:hypothetical protein
MDQFDLTTELLVYASMFVGCLIGILILDRWGLRLERDEAIEELKQVRAELADEIESGRQLRRLVRDHLGVCADVVTRCETDQSIAPDGE